MLNTAYMKDMETSAHFFAFDVYCKYIEYYL